MALIADNALNSTFEEMRPYKREFQYQECKVWSLLNSHWYRTFNIHLSHLFTFTTSWWASQLSIGRQIILFVSALLMHLWNSYNAVFWDSDILYNHHYLLGKGGYVFGSVGLSVCLFVCGQHYSKSYEWIRMKFYGRVLSSTRKNWLNYGGDLGIVRWVNEQKIP